MNSDPASLDEPPQASSGSLSNDHAPRGLCTFTIDLQAPDTQPPLRRWLLTRLREAASLLGTLQGHVGIVVVPDAVMADLHQQYKNVAGTTDVLSFDLREHPSDPLEAELILCRDEAARQAQARGHAVREELLLYAVHGLLHMLDYDDVTPAKARRMHAKEDEILTALGLGPLYDKDRQPQTRKREKASGASVRRTKARQAAPKKGTGRTRARNLRKPAGE